MYLCMPQCCKEEAYFPQHADSQLPRADLTWAEEQQSQTLHRMKNWPVRAPVWQSGTGLKCKENTKQRALEGDKKITQTCSLAELELVGFK